MTHLRIILNGKSAADARVRDAVATLRGEGHRIEVRPTWESGDVQRLTVEALRDAEAHGSEVIVAGGGDGTLNEVLGTAFGGHGPYDGSFGLLPLGTANDFARSAGIDASDITAALRRAATSEPSPVDIGTLDGRPFVNMVTGGFGSKVTAETDPQLKKHLGGLAYALTGLARLGNMTASTGRFRGEDFEWEGPFIAMAIGNGRQAGGGIPLCPEAVIDDGLLDLMILPATPPDLGSRQLIEVLREGRPMLRGLEVRSRSAWFEYEAHEELHVNLDGEPVVTQSFRVTCVPGALSLRLGPSPLLKKWGASMAAAI